MSSVSDSAGPYARRPRPRRARDPRTSCRSRGPRRLAAADRQDLVVVAPVARLAGLDVEADHPRQVVELWRIWSEAGTPSALVLGVGALRRRVALQDRHGEQAGGEQHDERQQRPEQHAEAGRRLAIMRRRPAAPASPAAPRARAAGRSARPARGDSPTAGRAPTRAGHRSRRRRRRGPGRAAPARWRRRPPRRAATIVARAIAAAAIVTSVSGIRPSSGSVARAAPKPSIPRPKPRTRRRVRRSSGAAAGGAPGASGRATQMRAGSMSASAASSASRSRIRASASADGGRTSVRSTSSPASAHARWAARPSRVTRSAIAIAALAPGAGQFPPLAASIAACSRRVARCARGLERPQATGRELDAGAQRHPDLPVAQRRRPRDRPPPPPGAAPVRRRGGGLRAVQPDGLQQLARGERFARSRRAPPAP